MDPKQTHDTHSSGRVTRRGVLQGAAWAVPVVAVAAATPLAAASQIDGGTLFLTGNAFADAGIYFTGTNYNGATSTVSYPAGALQITVVLPDVEPIEVTASGSWTAAQDGNVVTLTNSVELPAGSESGDLGTVEILGPFPAGSPYTITVSPSAVEVVYVGNIQPSGTF